MIAATVYILCAITSAAVAFLLLRGYARSKARLLVWSGLCFVGLTVNNVLLFVDKIILPDAVDLTLWRSAAALAALALLLYGLIWDVE
jgi:hypothetical protein